MGKKDEFEAQVAAEIKKVNEIIEAENDEVLFKDLEIPALIWYEERWIVHEKSP